MGIFSKYAPLYWEAGLPVMPCIGKRPIITAWDQLSERMPSAIEQADWIQRYPDCNIGLPLGPMSGLCAVDIDTDDPDEIAAIKDALADTPYVRVGKKGMVLIYRWNGEGNFKVRTGDGHQPVEFLGKGNQVIVAPSIHPETHLPYTASANLWDILDDIPNLSANFGKALLLRALRSVVCPISSATSSVKQGARHNELTSYVGQLRNQGHASTALAQMLLARNATFDPPLPDEEVKRIAAWGDGIEGCDGFLRNEVGKIVRASQANVQHALEELGVTIRFDQFAGKDMISGLPGHEGVLEDAAVRRVWFLIQEKFGFQPTKDFFWEVMLDLSRQNSFDPVCEELEKLQAAWDGTPRIDGWLQTYGGAVDTAYVRAVGSKMLIAATHRARQPGSKFDTMPVLSGPQGGGKSTACQILAGGSQRFTDHVPFNADAREVIEALSGRWIAEAGELQGLRNASAEKLKSFLSRTVDHGRAAYARTTQAVSRRCIFVGTTNSWAFLTDGTGNRRFWPVEVGTFDLHALARDRDQLIGEAASREAAGESIVLPNELWAVAAAEQDNCIIENPILSAIEEELEGWTGRIRSTDVWKLLKVPQAQQLSMAKAVSSAMQELGWRAGKHRFGGRNSERGYIKGTAQENTRILHTNYTGNVQPAPPQLENAA